MSVSEKNAKLTELEEQIREELSDSQGIVHPYIAAMIIRAATLAQELRNS